MKQIFVIILFLAFAFGLNAQTPLYTTGFTFCNGVPTHNPGTNGAKYAIDTVTFNLYVRSYGTSWTLIGQGGNWIQNISGCSAPAYTPTKFQSKIVINACNPAEVYAWDGSAWDKIAPSSGGISGTGLATRIAAWTASGALGYDVNMVLDTVNNRMGVNTAAPGRTLDVDGEARIRDLTTTTPTVLVAADANGVFSSATVGTGLSLSGGTLSSTATGTVTGTGLANRLAYWTGTGTVGFESFFRIDSVNNQLVSNGASAVGPISGVYPHFYSRSGTNAIGITPQWSFGPMIEITDGTVKGYGGGLISSSVMYVGTNTSHDFRIRRANADVMTFNSDGVTCGSFKRISFGAITSNTTTFLLYESSNTKYGAYAASGQLRFFAPSSGVPTPQISFGSVSTSDGTTWAQKAAIDIANTAFVIGHTATPTATIDANGGGATSATAAANFANSNDSTILFVRNDRRVGINTATPDVSLDAGDNTDGIKIPAGTTAQEPAVNSTIRINTTREAFEVRENGVQFRLTSSKTPTIAAGAAAGTGPTIAVAGNDLSGKITLTVGTSPTTGALCTVTFGSTMDAATTNYVTFSAADKDAANAITSFYVSAESNTSFTISVDPALTAGTEYIINYAVGQ